MTNRQRLFIAEYLRCWNATEAARRAGYAWPNKRGPELLVNSGIDAEIKRRLADLCMGPDETLVRLGEQARAAYAAYLTPEGTVDMARLLEDGKGHLVKGIKRTRYGDEVEFYDAQMALVKIGEHHKLFTQNINLGGGLTLGIVEEIVDANSDDAPDSPST